jgi:hypothetical protein
MISDAYQVFRPGPHEEALMPALVHRQPSGGFERCYTPANCEECAPKFNQRRGFAQARGADRELLAVALAEARRLDDAEARERARMPISA